MFAPNMVRFAESNAYPDPPHGGFFASSPTLFIPSVQAFGSLGASAIHAEPLADRLNHRLNPRGFQSAGYTLTK